MSIEYEKHDALVMEAVSAAKVLRIRQCCDHCECKALGASERRFALAMDALMRFEDRLDEIAGDFIKHSYRATTA